MCVFIISKAEVSRGDVTKSVQCYMIKESATEEVQDHIKGLISFAWRKLNEASARNLYPKSIIKMSLNMARAAQCIYQYGDGIGTSTGLIKDRLTSLIVDPIPIKRLNHEEIQRRSNNLLIENKL